MIAVALRKKVVMPHGLPLEYHRVLMVCIDVNERNRILVHSYLNEEARQYEKDYAAGLIKDPVFPYVHAGYYDTDYSGSMSVRAAYEWLKSSVREFEGAEDTDDVAGEVSGDEFIAMLEEVM